MSRADNQDTTNATTLPGRRKLLGGIVAFAAGAGLVAAELAPTPSWGAAASAGSDAELVALGVEQQALHRKVTPIWEAFFACPSDDAAELNRIAELASPAAERIDDIAEQMTDMSARTLPGWAAKAFAFRIELASQKGNDFDPDELGAVEALAWSLAGDLLRSAGVELPEDLA